MRYAKTMDGQDWGLLVFLSLLWGGAFFFTGIAVREVPPLTLVLARVAIAALLLLPIFFALGHRLPRTAQGWTPFLVMGLLNNVLPFGFIFAGQTYIGVGLSSIINAMTPLFGVLILAAFLEERLTAYRVLGVSLGVLGVAILKGFDATFSGDQGIGIGLCLLGALSYGFAALWARKRLSSAPPLKSAALQLLCSTAIMCVVASLVDQPWRLEAPSAQGAAAILALAGLGTALAYLVFFKLVVRAGAGNAVLVTLIIPISAMLLGALYLDETIRARELLGAAVIGVGLLFIDGRLVDWARGRPGMRRS